MKSMEILQLTASITTSKDAPSIKFDQRRSNQLTISMGCSLMSINVENYLKMHENPFWLKSKGGNSPSDAL